MNDPIDKNARFDRIYIEIGNVCNLKCDFCPEVDRQKKLMTPLFFDFVLKEVGAFTNQITMHLMGEPLAHPNFSQMIQVAERNGCPVTITTNGTLLDSPERAKSLLNPNVRQVNFSLQSFVANYPLSKMPEYFKSLFEFAKLAQEVRPDLYLNYRLWNVPTAGTDGSGQRPNFDKNKSDAALDAELLDQMLAMIDEFYQKSSFGDGFYRSVSGIRPKLSKEARVKKSFLIFGRHYIHFDSRFDWPTLSDPILSESGFCYGLTNHIGILAGGEVVPCCLDKEAKLVLGILDMDKNSTAETGQQLTKILNSSRAVAMKRGFENKKLVEPLCQRCNYIERFR
jgi:hypothetical protein